MRFRPGVCTDICWEAKTKFIRILQPVSMSPHCVPMRFRRGACSDTCWEAKSKVVRILLPVSMLPHCVPMRFRPACVQSTVPRDGSVALGPDAIRGRLREFENILVLVQIKDENWTKYKSNLSQHFSYISTDIDPLIIAHWFPPLGGDNDNGSCFHRVHPPIKIARNSDGHN
jgi:hypothetical protein